MGWTATSTSHRITEEQKAVNLMQFIIIADSLDIDIISLFSWYELGPDDEFGKQNPAEVGYGIISADLKTDLPAGAGIKMLLQSLNGYTFEFSEETGTNDYVAHYVNRTSNGHKLVYWTWNSDSHTNGSIGTTVSLPDETLFTPKPQIYILN